MKLSQGVVTCHPQTTQHQSKGPEEGAPLVAGVTPEQGHVGDEGERHGTHIEYPVNKKLEPSSRSEDTKKKLLTLSDSGYSTKVKVPLRYQVNS